MYSAKDIEELNAKNIEYPDGSMHTLYEAEQQQRAFERKIRATKRTLAACDEALNNLSDKELLQKLEKNFSHYSSKLKRQESELNSFCKKTGLLPDGSRSQVYGFGKSTSQKFTGVAKKYYRTWSKEHNINNIETLAEYYNVKYNDIERYKLLEHNDDIRNGVSLEDIKDAILNGKIKITDGGDSILHATEICGVTINPHTGNLIQVNPK
ncbi:MAG TPA: phage minor capsid protein [Ruminococcus bromii]|nr:phage minor capsid protein [Ruminococcus bromii]